MIRLYRQFLVATKTYINNSNRESDKAIIISKNTTKGRMFLFKEHPKLK